FAASATALNASSCPRSRRTYSCARVECAEESDGRRGQGSYTADVVAATLTRKGGQPSMGRTRTAARILALGALPLAGLAWFTPGALASSKPVCPGPAAPGSARCFAHVLTDPHGDPSATRAPSAYGPAQFHGAYGLPNIYP